MTPIQAKKQFGQHFLHDQKVLKSIVDAGEVVSTDTVVEIGAGKGILTQALVTLAKKVIAYEIDRECFPLLEALQAQHANLEIIHKSILDAEPPHEQYKVIANIPYYLTGTILRLFLHVFSYKPERLVLLVQKEVAEKIVSKENSLLALAVQVYGKAEIIRAVSRHAFTPKPKVESAIIRIIAHEKSPIMIDVDDFFRFLRPCFQGLRKQVQKTISNQVHLSREEVLDMLAQLGVDPQARPSTLDLPTWEKIVQKFLPHIDWKVTTSVSPKR